MAQVRFRPGYIGGLSLLLVGLALKVFLWVLWFSLLQKKNISKFQFDQDRGPAWKPAKADVTSSLNILNSFFKLVSVHCWLDIRTKEAAFLWAIPNTEYSQPILRCALLRHSSEQKFTENVHLNILVPRTKYRLYLRWDTVPLDGYWVRVCRCCTWWFGGDTRVNAGRVLERALARSADRWSMLLRERPRAAMGDSRDPGVLDATAWRESTRKK